MTLVVPLSGVQEAALAAEMKMSRLAMAMIAYAALGVLAATTLSDSRIRAVTLLILGLFAFKSWVRRKDVLHPDEKSEPR
jgi:uncharacterized membrane protein YfcA